MQCETGFRYYREFNFFFLKFRKSGVKPVLAPIGSLKFQKKNRNSVKPVPAIIGSVYLQKSFEKTV